MNSALRRLHERKQYRLHLFRTFCEAALIAATLAALIGSYLALSLVSKL
jgi:hypothetical protein